MDRLHDLLKTQLRGHFGELSEIPASLKPFLDEVHASYERLDKERSSLEQSLGQSFRELRRTNREMRAEKEQLAVTLRSIGDGVITANSRGEVMMMNQVAESLTGWSQAEALGRPLEEVLEVMAEGDQDEEAMVFRSHDTVNTSGTLVSRDGDRRTISSSLAPIRDRGGQRAGFVLVFRDVTEERRLEEERLRSTKLESIGILAGGIAHDFNNFLTAILGNISLARVKLADEGHDAAGLLSRSEIAARQARELTRQLLAFSMADAPAKKVASARVLIEECTSFVLRGANVRCEISITPFPPPTATATHLPASCHNV